MLLLVVFLLDAQAVLFLKVLFDRAANVLIKELCQATEFEVRSRRRVALGIPRGRGLPISPQRRCECFDGSGDVAEADGITSNSGGGNSGAGGAGNGAAASKGPNLESHDVPFSFIGINCCLLSSLDGCHFALHATRESIATLAACAGRSEDAQVWPRRDMSSGTFRTTAKGGPEWKAVIGRVLSSARRDISLNPN